MGSTPRPVPGGGAARLRLACAGVFLLALFLHAPMLRYGFTGWDDTAYVPNNPHVTSASAFWRIWTSSEAHQYYPLTFSSYWVEYRIWGARPAAYHATNMVLHAINSVLVLLLLRALGSGVSGAVLASALFAVHPVQVMTVAWVAERKNLLSCLFALVAILAWMKSDAGRKRRLFHAISLLAFIAALLGKTAVLGLPVALALLDRLVLRRFGRETVLRLIPMLVASAAALLVTWAFEEKFVDRAASTLIPGLAGRFQIAGAAPWFYLGKLLLPVGLSPAYPRWSIGASRFVWWVPLAITSILAAGFVLLLPRLRTEAASRTAWGGAFFLIMLGPSLGLIPFGNLALTFVSDHFLYVSAAGFFAVLSLAFERATRRGGLGRRVVWTAAGVAGVLLCVKTLAYQPVFRSAMSLWSRVVELDPDSYAGNLGLAEALAVEGRTSEAMARYEKALRIRPDAVDAYLLLGEAKKRLQDPAGAEALFRRALTLSPQSVDAMVGLASVLGREETALEARGLFERAVRLAPSSVPARMGLGGTLLGFAEPEEALAQFESVEELRPDYPRGYLGAATCLRSLTRYGEAVAVLRRGLARAGDDVALENLLALTLATAPHDEARNGPEAVALSERASAAAGDEAHDLLDTLAAAYAEAGRFDDAVRASVRAEASASRAGDEPAAAESRRRTDLYRGRLPLRLGR